MCRARSLVPGEPGATHLQRLGRIEEAARELEAVSTEFLDRRMPVVALIHCGRSEALKILTAEILSIFETRGLTA